MRTPTSLTALAAITKRARSSGRQSSDASLTSRIHDLGYRGSGLWVPHNSNVTFVKSTGKTEQDPNQAGDILISSTRTSRSPICKSTSAINIYGNHQELKNARLHVILRMYACMYLPMYVKNVCMYVCSAYVCKKQVYISNTTSKRIQSTMTFSKALGIGFIRATLPHLYPKP